MGKDARTPQNAAPQLNHASLIGIMGRGKMIRKCKFLSMNTIGIFGGEKSTLNRSKSSQTHHRMVCFASGGSGTVINLPRQILLASARRLALDYRWII